MNAPFKLRLLLLLTLVAGLIAAAPAGPGTSSVAAQPDPIPPSARFNADEIVIQFRPGVDEQRKTNFRGPLNLALKRQLRKSAAEGDLELAALPPGITVDEAISRARNHPDVRFVEPNFIYTADETSNDPYYTGNQLWGMYGEATTPANEYGSQAGEAWAAGFTGSTEVYVAVTDHGVRLDHQDLRDNIWTNPFDPVDGVDNDGNGYVDDSNGWDFANGDRTVYDSSSEDQTDGHGTHVAGTIGAAGNNGQGVAGVNWRVKLIITKYLGDSGGSSANIPPLLDYLIDLKDRHKLNIVATNNSYGGSGYSRAVCEAIGRARAVNILFVASAGNNNRNNDSSPYYPASYTTSCPSSAPTSQDPGDNVLAVAAIESNGSRRSTSSWGTTSVDLGAPGGSVMSTIATSSSAYGSKSGTSMAAPHVTGAVALYASKFPGASAAQIKSAILSNTAPTASLDEQVVSDGRLDVAKALGASSPVPISTPTATLTAGPSSTPAVTLTAGPTSAATSTRTPVATSSPTPTATTTTGGTENHVGDMNGSSRNLKKGRWQADARITVHNASHDVVSGAQVSGTFTWTGGTSSGECTTGSAGTCVMSAQLPNATSGASFAVTQLSPNYAPSLNHDPGGDSDGTTVWIPK
jgi:subtilisin family serine protease